MFKIFTRACVIVKVFLQKVFLIRLEGTTGVLLCYCENIQYHDLTAKHFFLKIKDVTKKPRMGPLL